MQQSRHFNFNIRNVAHFQKVMGKMSTICNLDFVDYNFWCYILLSLHINHRRSIFVSKSTIDPHTFMFFGSWMND
ncbi:hypothetical protein BLOT_013451 [Blomia tropicalis]|nr:hypothetical protein BLOT_013451 [Blomia tropicalis]